MTPKARYVRTQEGKWVLNDGSSPASKPAVPAAGGQPSLSSARRDKKPVAIPNVVPPNDGEVEQAVLGSMMVEIEAVVVARQVLSAQSFYYDEHRAIFQACCQLADRGVTPDIVMVYAELRDMRKDDKLEGTYLADCINRVTTAAHVGHYAKKVQALYLEREIIKACSEVGSKQNRDALDWLQDLHMAKQQLDAPFMFDYTVNMANILEQIKSPKISKRFNTFYPTIDAAWKGMKPGELNTWAAATNDGKSVLLLNLLDRAAVQSRCLYVGTEMSSIETIERHLSIQSNVEAWKIRKPELGPRDLPKLDDAVKVMSKMNVSILDDPEPNLEKIEAAIHACKAEIVFLDYLERFEMPRADQLRLQIKEFMRQLKTLARRTGTVIHLAAQLNRDVYGAEQRPPTLADLSESSAIEKESDRVVLLWSPAAAEGRHTRGKPPTAVGQGPTISEHCRLIQALGAKNRHGPKGLVFEFVLNQLNLKIQEIKEYADPFNHPV